ncbi:MAG TPA: helix-turn-helix transcriptional regulator [Solirubrobacteraceae bacterium]|jgi:transcriptional regulator with XRE-family HTH domain|nr:helix-turn-helix transcriptional regulator [Solirubrobacteraceae bacterium]
MFVSNDRVAGELIAEVRRKSGLSQTDLARLSGVQAPVLSAYEHGRRQPSVAALARIARAAGVELAVSELSDEAALERAGRTLIDVLGLADRMPSRDRGELSYPPLIRLAS